MRARWTALSRIPRRSDHHSLATVFDSLPDDVAAGVIETTSTAQVDSMKAAITWTSGFVLVGVAVGTFLPGGVRRKEPQEGPRPARK